MSGPTIEDGAKSALSGGFERIAQFQELRDIQLGLVDASVEWDDLIPLLSCRRTEIVIIEAWKLSMAVTDEGLLAMAKAWPFLEYLSLDDPTLAIHQEDGVTLPAATLKGLACFALHNPYLETLHVSVDCRGTGECMPGAVGPNVKDLSLQRSIADADARGRIVNFLAKMWPNQVTNRDLFSWEYYGDREQYDLWMSIWGGVVDRLNPGPWK